MKFATKLLHGMACGEKFKGSTTFPIHQTASYRQETAEDLEKIFSGRKAVFVYTRAVAFSSSMVAIAAAEEKLNAGVTEGLVRISAEIEDIEDLTADFLAALRKI